MLTVLTTEDFAAWFRALGDRDAEEVATVVEVIETLGPERSPPSSSDLLLWYQSASGRGRLDRYGSERIAFAQQAHRVVKHLSSEPARRRLNEISAVRAARVAVSIALIRERTRRWRHGFGGRDEGAWRELMAEYRSVLETLDLSEPEPDLPKQSLREINLMHCEPGMRLLYGIDAPNQCALMILGEALDRCAYGPSVRRALSLWRQFCASDAELGVVAAGSGR